MLKTMSGKNLRQHEEITLNFVPGLNIIRAANEGGKSTCIEGFGYTLFGSKALDEPIEDVVTWGKVPNDLQVVTTIELVSGVNAVIKRGGRGAEVLIPSQDKTVTGQTECTKEIESILGVSAAQAYKLLIAKQTDIRGALAEKGKAAATTLIEDLAGMDQIDRIIELIKDTKPNGKNVFMEEQLESKQKGLEELGEINEDFSELEAEIKEADEAYTLLVNKKNDSADGLTAPTEERTLLIGQKETIKKQIDALADDRVELERLRKKTEELETAIKATPSEEDKQGISKNLMEAEAFLSIHEAESALDKIEVPDDEWDEPRSTLEAEIETNKKAWKKYQADNAERHLEIAGLRPLIITTDKCPTCGTTLENKPEVVEASETAEQRISTLTAEIIEVQDLISECEDSDGLYRGLLKTDDALFDFIISYGHLCDVDDSVVPRKVVMTTTVADVPSKEVLLKGIEDLNAEMDRLEALSTTADRAEAQIDQVYKSFEQTTSRVNAAEEISLPEDIDISIELLDVKIKGIREVIVNLDRKIANVNDDRAILADQLSIGKALATDRKEQKKKLAAEIKEIKGKLKDAAFYNQLLKDIRAARPLIANKLWRSVLHIAGTYFSTARGRISVVSRNDKRGFIVDGKPATSLSGSAQDMLGLAIRMALVRVFIPNAAFFILDEPGAGCDAERTANMVGLLKASDFKQIILITHNEVDESAADNIIEL